MESVFYKVFIAMAFLGSLILLLPTIGQTPRALYLDPNPRLEKRIDDLISKMALEEKVSQLMNDFAPIDRLRVPGYNWWNEALHGVGRAERATVFPQAVGLAATGDTDLMFRVATAISDEGRAKDGPRN